MTRLPPAIESSGEANTPANYLIDYSHELPYASKPLTNVESGEYQVARFHHGNPPRPGLYLARVEILHGDTLLYTRRCFEEWDGTRWVHVGWNGTTGGRVSGWVEVDD